MNVIEKFEEEQQRRLLVDKHIPDFSPGDTLKVGVRVVEGEKVRIQNFEGVCIARHCKAHSIGASFTVRKIAAGGEGVERVFPLLSPNVKSIDVVRRGKVRRAKLHYLRQLRGKKARIKEDTRYLSKSQNSSKED